MTPPTFHQALTAWNMAIKGEKHFPLPLEIVCETAEIFNNQCAQLGQAKVAANKAGYPCQFNKSGKGARMAAWITSGGFTLKIAFTATKTPKHTNTTTTSRNAYHSTDFSTQSGKVAQIIMSKTGEDITRAEIAYILQIQEGRVSARVNALLKQYGEGGFKYGDSEYRLVLTAQRLSKCPGASEKLNEAIRFQKCEPAADAVQTKLEF
jgi:hypothetical protein